MTENNSNRNASGTAHDVSEKAAGMAVSSHFRYLTRTLVV